MLYVLVCDFPPLKRIPLGNFKFFKNAPCYLLYGLIQNYNEVCQTAFEVKIVYVGEDSAFPYKLMSTILPFLFWCITNHPKN